MPQTTPIISGGMNAVRLPAFFKNLGHCNVILTDNSTHSTTAKS
jgi:ribulose-bisphosphate carboxylase large chain